MPTFARILSQNLSRNHEIKKIYSKSQRILQKFSDFDKGDPKIYHISVNYVKLCWIPVLKSNNSSCKSVRPKQPEGPSKGLIAG